MHSKIKTDHLCCKCQAYTISTVVIQENVLHCSRILAENFKYLIYYKLDPPRPYTSGMSGDIHPCISLDGCSSQSFIAPIGRNFRTISYSVRAFLLYYH